MLWVKLMPIQSRLLRPLESTVKSSFALSCAAEIARNALGGLRRARGDLGTDSGTQTHGLAIEEALAYVDEVYEDYRRYGEIERFHGRVAEVGPGDNCGLALRLLADGCEAVDLVDRFFCARAPGQNRGLYERLVARSERLQERLQGATLGDESSFEGIVWRYGEAAASERYFRTSPRYDFILSRAVLEHVSDPILSIEQMAQALAPGGMLLHKVDLRDHGMFSDRFHELKFLEVPDPIYEAMVRGSGRPNRVLVDRYRAALEGLPGLQTQLRITRLAGVGDVIPHLPWERIDAALRARSLDFVRRHRPRFARSFARLSDEDLCVAGIFVSARRGSPEEN